MSDFFKLADGGEIERNGSFEQGGGFEIIPAGTELLAAIVEAKWQDMKLFNGGGDTGQTYEGINIKWQVQAPEEYKNRVVFQKLHLGHPDPKKVDTSKKMFVAIDTNCGGALFKAGKKPTDMDLMSALVANSMMIKVSVHGKKGEKQGNYVSAVAEKPKGNSKPAANKDIGF